MLQFLRWATFLLLGCVVIGAALSYPVLRERFLSPMTAPAAFADDTQQAGTSTPEAVVEPAASQTPTSRPKFTATQPLVTVPAVIIQAPTPTIAKAPTTVQAVSPPASAPSAIATTSLLPAGASATPVVVETQPRLPATVVVSNPTLAVPTPAPTGVTTAPLNAAGQSNVVVTTPLPPTPTPTAAGAQPAPGEKGALSPVEAQLASATPTTLVVAQPSQPVGVTPVVVTTVEISPATPSADVKAIVVVAVELTPSTATPTALPAGPTAAADSPLFSAPDINSPVVGQVAQGTPLVIVGLYTEGTWYLLVTGQWIPGSAVNNAPLIMPLVFPTITPVPTNTPTLTPLPPPTQTPPGAPTPTPTPTSLDATVCDCSGDSLDCLGNIFANRAQAQQCFEYCFRQTGRDIHLLDANLNGMACENLP